MKKTALFDEHVKLNAKMVAYAGYQMPIQYTGIKFEHEMVRTKAGLFDVSHMGEIAVTGDAAEDLVQKLFVNGIRVMQTGDVRYSPMCYANGGTVDDVLIYKVGDDMFCLVVNAANKDKDLKWINQQNTAGAQIADETDTLQLLALQGPKAEAIASRVFAALPKDYYSFIDYTLADGYMAVISRTGYTGEDGFEIYCDRKNAPLLWKKLLAAGGDDIAPCGLGARDTLRLECAMPLYGQELTQDITPIEAGLGFFVKLDSDADFVGKTALTQQKRTGNRRWRYGVVLTDKGVARQGDAVWYNEKQVGMVTSGTKSITLGVAIALILVEDKLERGTTVELQVRSKRLKAKTVKLPFYKRQK